MFYIDSTIMDDNQWEMAKVWYGGDLQLELLPIFPLIYLSIINSYHLFSKVKG